MKMTLVLAFFLFMSPHVSLAEANATVGAHSRSNQLLRFLAAQEGLRNYSLYTLISNRCSRYLDSNETTSCKEAVKKMIALLDYDIIIPKNKIAEKADETWQPQSFVFVAFKSNLVNLLSTGLTTNYLNDLNQRLYKYLVENGEEPNIWAVTKLYFKNDYLTSLVLATLFQDTSPVKLHLAYLREARINGNVHFRNNEELLSRVIDTVNLILDNSEDKYRALFYPPEIQRDLNRNIYHFYVPLFLAYSLVKSGTSKEAAFHASLMLTLTYEFVTYSQDYRYLLTDPANMTNTYQIKDIFGGYCGSNIGVWGMDFNKSFEGIRASFNRSTTDAVEILLKR